MQPMLHDQQMSDPQASGAHEQPDAGREEFYWMMSLALDGLLDEAEQTQFEERMAQDPALAALWNKWQGLDHTLNLMPHAEPAPGFVSRFEDRLAQQEARQQQRVLAFSLAAVVLVALLAVGGLVGGIAYLTSTQGPWLGEQIHNLVLLSATAGAWLNALLDTMGALSATPQAQGLGLMYVVVAMIMIYGWVQLLRRSARLPGAVALPPRE